MNAGRIREQAALCRRLSKQATNANDAERLRVLAADYDEMAERIEKAKHRSVREAELLEEADAGR
jgi:hypothetical protein